MRQEREKLPPVIQLPKRSKDQPTGVPESIPLAPQVQVAIEEIRKREGHTDATPEDVVALAVEVFNVLTKHLSGKDSTVILHTQGQSLQTLDIKSSAGSHMEGVRTVYKRVQRPKR